MRVRDYANELLAAGTSGDDAKADQRQSIDRQEEPGDDPDLLKATPDSCSAELEFIHGIARVARRGEFRLTVRIIACDDDDTEEGNRDADD